MKVRVDAATIAPGHSAGVEAFTYGLLGGLAKIPELHLEVEALRGTGDTWRHRVPDSHVQWSEVDVALRPDGALGKGLRRWLPASIRSSTSGRRLVNFVRGRARPKPAVPADVTLHPFHGVPVTGAPAAVVVHDLRHFQEGLGTPGYSAIIRANIQRASAVIVSWPHPYEQVREEFPDALDRTVLIPPPAFHPRPVHRQPEPEPGLLLYPSSTAPHKNHATLVEAMAALPEYRLVCPGPLVEPEATALRRRADKADVRGRVTFPGFVTVPELEALYARADMVVVPSTWEAASGAIFEAFSWGIPVVCADVPPLRAQVSFADGEVCFFAPREPASLARAVRTLRANREHYAEAAVRAGRCLAGRSWVDTAHDYADVLRWVASGSAGPIPRTTFGTHEALR